MGETVGKESWCFISLYIFSSHDGLWKKILVAVPIMVRLGGVCYRYHINQYYLLHGRIVND